MSLFEITSFSKILDAILSSTKVRNFLIPLSMAFSNPTITRSGAPEYKWCLQMAHDSEVSMQEAFKQNDGVS